MQHVGEVVGPVYAVGHRYVQRPLQAFYYRFRHVFPLINVRSGFRRSANRRVACFNLVPVVVAEPGHTRQPAVALELQADLFIDAGLCFQIVIAHQVTGTGAGVAALAAAVEDVVRVGLIQAWGFIRAGDAHFQRNVVRQPLGEVQGRAPVIAHDGVMVKTQARRQHGAVGQLHIVFRKQREDLGLGVGAAVGWGNPGDGAAFGQRLGVGRQILHALLIPLAAQRQGLVDQQIQRQVDFTMQQHIGKVDIREVLVGEDPFGATGQTFVIPRVTGVFVLRVGGGGDAVIPAAVPGQRVVLAIETVGLFTVILFHQRIGVGILSIARVEVALAAVARLQLQRVHGGKIPAQLTVYIFVFHPLAPSRHGTGVAAGA